MGSIPPLNHLPFPSLPELAKAALLSNVRPRELRMILWDRREELRFRPDARGMPFPVERIRAPVFGSRIDMPCDCSRTLPTFAQWTQRPTIMALPAPIRAVPVMPIRWHDPRGAVYHVGLGQCAHCQKVWWWMTYSLLFSLEGLPGATSMIEGFDQWCGEWV